MDAATVCVVVATLAVLPNRSQFFQHDSVSVSCEQQGNASDWSVMRNTSRNTNQVCPTTGDTTNKSVCVIESLYWTDSGVYWCESGAGDRSNTINISVTDGPVILDVPVRPVKEGDDVTLRCKRGEAASSSVPAVFYRDERLVWSSSTGAVTIPSVSRSHEGLYRCSVPGVGGSPGSWLAVTEACGGRPPSLALRVLLPVVAACLSLASPTLLCLCRRRKGKDDPDVIYTDVSVTHTAEPQRIQDVDATETFYSIVKVTPLDGKQQQHKC